MRNIFVILTYFIWFACVCVANVASAKEAEWTFLLYLAADNNLEAAQLADLHEMIATGSSEQVQFVALVDRSPKDDTSQGYSAAGVANLPDWTTSKLVHIERGRLVELASWGVINMGDPATLKRFLETSTKQFPAKKYALIFGDHGAGWPGVCSDESHHYDKLTMTEIHNTLKSLPKAISRFELIGFDACLMGNLECAFTLAPFAKVMVASEELEPGYGWYYTPLFQRVVDRPAMSGAEVGKVIVETFDDFYRKSPHERIRNAGLGTTLSAIDLSKLDGVLTNLKTLAKTCQDDLSENGRDSWLSMAQARVQSEEFGRKDEHGNGMGLIDLGHLLKLISTRFGEGSVDTAAQAVAKSLKLAIVANRHGKGRAHAHGLSIFFPADHEQLMGETEETDADDKAAKTDKSDNPYLDAYANTLFAKSNPWLGFVTDFTVATGMDTEGPLLGEIEATAEKISPGETVTFSAELKSDDIETKSFVLAKRKGDKQTIIGELPATEDEDGNLSDEWDGKWFTLKSGDQEFICPVTDMEPAEGEEDDDDEPDEEKGKPTEYYIEVPVQLQRKNKNKWIDITLYFYVDMNEDEITGEFVYAFEDTKAGPREVDLKSGDRIRPVFLVVADDGKETQVPTDDEDQIIEIDDPDEDLNVGMMAVPAGKYEVGFQVYDYSENYSEQFVEIQVTK